MQTPGDEVQSLSNSLIYELTKALALPQTSQVRRLVQLVFGRAAGRFAELAVGLDRKVAEDGVASAARWLLPRFARDYASRGVENIPPDGPLVIASNHPGSFDSVVLVSQITRLDFKMIVGDIPFFEQLPHISQHAIYAPVQQDTFGRMQVIRQSIRHLAEGGALLIFARGGIEPDPAFMPAPDAEFDQWSRSLQIFLERVPQTRILVTIVSGVISRAAMSHPITWLRKRRPDRQRLAFMLQMARQVLSGREMFGLRPRVSFGNLISLQEAGGVDQVLPCVNRAARAILSSHIQWQQENSHANF